MVVCLVVNNQCYFQHHEEEQELKVYMDQSRFYLEISSLGHIELSTECFVKFDKHIYTLGIKLNKTGNDQKEFYRKN